MKAWVLQALMLQGAKSNKQLLFPVQMFQFQSHCWGEQRGEEHIISKDFPVWGDAGGSKSFSSTPFVLTAMGCAQPSQKNQIAKVLAVEEGGWLLRQSIYLMW